MVDYAYIPKYWNEPEPIIQMEGHTYFVDLRNKVFGNPWKPLDTSEMVHFSSAEGQRLCRLVHVVTCRKCGNSVIVRTDVSKSRLRCMRCFSRMKATGHDGRSMRRSHGGVRASETSSRVVDPAGKYFDLGECFCDIKCLKGHPVRLFNVGRTHVVACDTCRVYATVGENLMSSWRQETKDIWQANWDSLRGYKKVRL